jgi:hypothetical protein
MESSDWVGFGLEKLARGAVDIGRRYLAEASEDAGLKSRRDGSLLQLGVRYAAG